MRDRRSRRSSLIIKRALDIAGSLVLLVFLCLPSVLIGIVIAVTMGRPILFKQCRPGLKECPFRLWKFRTMIDSGPKAERPDRERVTPFGRILRSTSLDELPQIINVLRGQMSFIGPRPLLVRYLPYYTESERLRFTMRPGIAGWAQVQGRNEIGWNDRLALDVWYVENWSLVVDLKIAVKAVTTVLLHRGFVDDPESLMANLDVERQDQPYRSDVR